MVRPDDADFFFFFFSVKIEVSNYTVILKGQTRGEDVIVIASDARQISAGTQ